MFFFNIVGRVVDVVVRWFLIMICKRAERVMSVEHLNNVLCYIC